MATNEKTAATAADEEATMAALADAMDKAIARAEEADYAAHHAKLRVSECCMWLQRADSATKLAARRKLANACSDEEVVVDLLWAALKERNIAVSEWWAADAAARAAARGAVRG